MTGLGAFAVLAIVALRALWSWGRARWHGPTRALEARLHAARQPPPVAHHHACGLDGLPPPVQRFFRAALRDGQPIVTGATLRHSGTFNLGETTDR